MNTNAASRGVKRSRKATTACIPSSSGGVAKRTKTERPKTAQKPAEAEKRLRPFRKAQPKAFDAIWERATSERFFVLKRERCDADDCPQEDFELAGTTGNVYSIKIARQPVCNCPYALKGNQCKHTIYILHRVLKAPRHHVYQLALLASELQDIYAKLPQPGADADTDAKNRKAVEGECAICYMDLDKGNKKSIVWCRAACGQNFDKICFDTWARACGSRNVTCPLCRSPWETDDGNAGAVTAVDTAKAVESADGYANVANQLGISGDRDHSTYSRWMNNYQETQYNYQNRRRRL